MHLITDLALILIVAGITTLIFKRLKQPLILGYILAGFLTGPHMPYTPSVEEMSNIQTWSEIGVIFIMFTLGLEFSFKRIVKMGIGPIIAALCVIFSMITLGSMVGRLFGWTLMNSLFLGGMVAMSSTTVIYKALDELGMRQQKFASVVLSVLILEDILGILLMVILSTMAAVGSLEGMQLVGSLVQLGFFLILWFVVGIFVVPQVLRRNSKWISRETLLVVSVGLCFLMVVLAEKAGYSAALGAFMMGSILAETVEAENIEHIVSPVKDLFGAIFFVSVGMLVDPGVLVEYWLPILSIIAVILFGQTFFATLSFLISGQPLKVAMQCSFSLTQIGEFSFILAALGVSLGVTSDYLYPVVVAVSIITTFTTPYMIKAAIPVYNIVEHLLPKAARERLVSEHREASPQEAEQEASRWKQLLSCLLVTTTAYVVLTSAAIGICFSTVLPFCRGILGHWPGNAVCGLVTLVAIAPFVRPIVMKKFHGDEVRHWRQTHSLQGLAGFGLTLLVRFALATAAVWYILEFLSPARWYWHVLLAALLVTLVCVERFGKRKNRLCLWVKYISIRMERTFLHNFRGREIRARAKRPGYANTLQRHDVHLSQLSLPEGSLWGGKTLLELNFGHEDGVMVAAVIRGSGRINIPDGSTMLFPGDRLEVLGDDESLDALALRMNTEVSELTPNDQPHRLILERLRIGKQSPFAGRSLYSSDIRSRYQCMAVGFENKADGTDTLELATSDRPIWPGDVIWVVGEEEHIRTLVRANNIL
ncbi:MAG: cation:proton antiporter [Bacteroidales bacterium]|nr:cation:proton antiporter [Bacteroidales bacterium]MBR1645053.1 cation:proton antiporter [Bacteroidales bacterium]